jgi:hypothetical protein
MIEPYHSRRREVTRTAARMIQTKLETWEGSIKTDKRTVVRKNSIIVRPPKV